MPASLLANAVASLFLCRRVAAQSVYCMNHPWLTTTDWPVRRDISAATDSSALTSIGPYTWGNGWPAEMSRWVTAPRSR